MIKKIIEDFTLHHPGQMFTGNRNEHVYNRLKYLIIGIVFGLLIGLLI